MKLIRLIFLSLFLSANALALDKCYSAAYYDPTVAGEGITLLVSDDKVVLHSYAHIEGFADYITSSSTSNVFTAYQTLNIDGVLERFDIGTITLDPDPLDNTKIAMAWSYEVNLRNQDTSIPWCLGNGCSGTKNLVALFRPTDCE